MNLAADLNFNLGKGAALFQKRKARADKWVIDENNVKKAVYPAPSSPYVGATTRPWGQRAPSWSDSEGPSNSPVRGIQSPSPVSVMSPTPVQNGPRFGDFNAKPKGFGSWNSDSKSNETKFVFESLVILFFSVQINHHVQMLMVENKSILILNQVFAKVLPNHIHELHLSHGHRTIIHKINSTIQPNNTTVLQQIDILLISLIFDEPFLVVFRFFFKPTYKINSVK